MTHDEIQDLARTVAALPREEEIAVADAVAAIRAERARLEEERIADLRSMTDLQVAVLTRRQVGDEAGLTLLREAGFVRDITLEAAYRAGYGRAVFDGGGTQEIPSDDDEGYIAGRGFDLAKLTRAS
ncbi:hypothetical protein [Methylobacterium sp. Leaf88]|uniref:hypothetical protein n=1 Tax=Methylobacterium sp. Leaf88 TaxID=1736244 RepID=UPI0006FDD64B|nr:hypothetical protein [Methylobacterium sp. Leaf88]KQO61745.1 hypothetical protein ASF20_09755 [Methylobacterium sp. Leaf88]